MSKFTPASILAAYNSVASLNNNFDEIADLFDNTLSRDGTAPNAMLSTLDMNHFKIENLADGVVDQDAVTLGQLKDEVGTYISTLTKGDPGSPGEGYSTRVAIAGITAPFVFDDVYLTETRREGKFVYNNTNLSAEVTLDPQQGMYIAPSFDTTGASGAWVRKTIVVTPFMFGAIGDAVTNDKVPIDAMNTWFFNSVRTRYYADFTGNFGYGGTCVVGPTVNTDTNNERYNCGGNFRIVQLTNGTFETIKPTNLGTTTWNGSMTAQGIGGTTFASRTCAIGINFVNCSLLTINGELKAMSFWYIGVGYQSQPISPNIGSNDSGSFGIVRSYYCGSGLSIAGFSLTANWSAPTNNGTTNSTVQTTSITVDTLPDAAIETYRAVGNQPIGVVIAGQYYYVQSWNRTTKVINIYPWLDNTSFATGSGTLRWVFGAGLALWGSDSGIVSFDHVMSLDCGIGLDESALYGSRVKSANLTSNGIGLSIGAQTAGAHIGTCIDAMYTEANDFDIIVIAARGGNFRNYITSSYALDFSKVFALSPRLTDGTMVTGAMGSGQSGGDNPFGGMPMAANGYYYWFHKRPIGGEAGNITFREHSRPPRILTQHLDSCTITLAVVGAGEYNRLFGYDGATLRYVGSGNNGAPTGTMTFTPPAGGTINGGSVNASVTFTGFYGPVDFEVYHKDTAQLNWVVRAVAGYKARTSITYDPPSIAAAASVTQTVAVANVALGDFVLASFSNSLAGLTLSAYVSSAGVVTCVFTNNTAAAVDLASGTLSVIKVG